MLRKILSVLALSSVIANSVGLPVDAGYVRGYYRKDGTYVRPHYRSNPGYKPSTVPVQIIPQTQYEFFNYNFVPIPILPVNYNISEQTPASSTISPPLLLPEPIDIKSIGSCEDVVFNSVDDLKDNRDLIVSIELKKAKDAYGTAPQNRPYYYLISMSGNPVDSIFGSPQLLRTISRRIINKCSSISAIAFGRSGTGEVYTFGIFPNQEVDSFQCVEPKPSNFNKLRWGQEYCNL